MGFLDPQPNTLKVGDRVRVIAGGDDLVGKTGTVTGVSAWSLGANDANTNVQLDEWDYSLGEPIFSDVHLEKIEG